MLDVRNCPGRRVLILGNHDVKDTEALRDAGFVEQHAAALCATEPALALTHMPLRRVPLTAINVHGHLHGVPAPSPAAPERLRRADQLRARPARLASS